MGLQALLSNIFNWSFLFHCGLFFRFGSVQPIYINLIRDPLARLVSSFYFHRFGDHRGGNRSWSFKGTEEEKNMVGFSNDIHGRISLF